MGMEPSCKSGNGCKARDKLAMNRWGGMGLIPDFFINAVNDICIKFDIDLVLLRCDN